jgi:hypothetical protein
MDALAAPAGGQDGIACIRTRGMSMSAIKMKPVACLGQGMVGLLGLLVVATVAQAEDKPLALAGSGGVYGSVEVGVSHIDYPKNRFFADRGEASPFTRNYNLDTEDNDAYGRAISGALGTRLPVALMRADGMRIELRGGRTDADQTSLRSFTDPGAGVRYGWVALDNSTGFGTPDGATLLTRIRQKIDYWGADLLLAFDYKLGDAASWSFLVGPSYKSLDQDTHIDGTISSVVALTESLSTHYRGIKLAAQYDRRLNDLWSMSAGFAASPYRAHATYRALYVVSPTTINRTLSDKSDALGLDARLEFSRRLSGRIRVAAFGEVSHLSDVPRVSYGSVPTDLAGGVLALASGRQTTWILGIRLGSSF